MFTARNRQNPFAKRRRAQAEAEQAQAVEFDRNPESEEYVQAPDISTYATGGVVKQPAATETVPDEVQPELVEIAKPVLSPETQAKIDAVMNHAIPPVALIEAAEKAEKRDFSTGALEESITAPEDEPKRGRGRPRPQETIDRDNAVHALLVGADAETGISKESIAAELDEKEQQVYSSLRQLSKEGRAVNRYVKPHGYRWFAA